MKKKSKFIILIILLIILCLSVGYSAYGTKLSIFQLSSSIRLNKDIRVTGISVVTGDNDGISKYEEYNVNNVYMGLNLPTPNSTVTYKINITNFESTEMGIFDITGLPDSLEYSIDENTYVLKDKICDNNKNCSLGISKDIYITIGYKDSMFNTSNTEYNINLKFDFRPFHTITYIDFGKNYLSEVIDGDNLKVNFAEDAPYSVRVYSNGVEYNNFNYLNGILSVNNVTENLKIISYVEEPNILNSGLYPVKYVNNNWVVCSSLDDEWYNYSKQEWANAVILKDNITKNVGDVIDVSSEVMAMFVWIPKFEFKISNNNTNEIYINFIPQENSTSSEGYIIHPAFKFSNNNLSGIWFGKFETSTIQTSECYINTIRDNCNNSEQIPYIIPNAIPLREQSVYYQYLTAKKMINYLSDSSNADSHMVKNNEWGAVAYLSQSRYGKYGNNNYIGNNKEVYANTSSNLYTGMSGGFPSFSDSELLYHYDEGFKYDNNGNLIQQNGIGASTTGNITGIYDMNGGSYEYVMGYLTTASSTFGSAYYYNYADFPDTPDDKYYDNFTSTDINTACNGDVCYGQALSETSGWYSDEITFVTSDNPWLMRGGVYDNKSGGNGIFSYVPTLGYSGGFASFRIALVFT